MQNYIPLAVAALMISSAIWFARRLWAALVAMQDDEDLPQRSRTFFSRQFRRRIQIAAMIGLSGVMLVAAVLLSPKNFPQLPFLQIIFASLTLFLLLWSILIAVFDIISISMFYRRSRHWDDAQRAKIRYELEQRLKEMQDEDHNEETKES